MKALLDNIAWHALTGPQAAFAAGSGAARRYAAGFSPIVGFEDAAHPDFAALAPHCAVDEHFYCIGWSGAAPAGWQIDAEKTIVQMVWDAGAPSEDTLLRVTELGPPHAAQALELATLMRPGPFGLRTPELGDYVGCFDGEHLIAMAGERMAAGTLREISGVCTHPSAQGRGLAGKLMRKLIRRQLQRGELPFLHVMRDNEHAYQLYLRMGFGVYRESVVRVISRC